MNQIRTKAIVVHRTNFGEADRILHLLTPDHGIVSVIAKGARREKSKLAGGIELFTIADVTFLQGKSDIATLTGARMNTYFMHILDDYAKLQLGYEAIKQVRRAAEMVPEPAFFTLLSECFEALNDPTLSLKLIESWLWLQLAILQGVGLNLASDKSGQKLAADQRYDFDDSQMEFVISEQGSFTADHIKLLRLLSAQKPQVAAHVKGINDLIDQCYWITQRLRP